MESQDYNFDDVLEQNRGFQQSVTECTGKFVNSYFAQFVSVGRQCHVPSIYGYICITLYKVHTAFECVRVTYSVRYPQMHMGISLVSWKKYSDMAIMEGHTYQCRGRGCD